MSAPPIIDYTTLSPAQLRAELVAIADEVPALFGGLDARRLNWRPDAARWSVAQCVEHLLAANRQMLQAAADALDGAHPRSVWQRLPLLPGLFGRLLIRSQAPQATRKFKAPGQALPSASAIDAAVIDRFVEQQRELAMRLQALEGRDLGRVVMVSPFVKVIAYSVLDGWRLIVAHEHRHLEQARRVTESPGFPR